MNLLMKSACMAATLALASTAVHATDSAGRTASASGAAPAPSGWHISASPYFWAASISGSTGINGAEPLHMTSGFGQLLKNIDFAFMGLVEARKDRFSLIGDIVYTKLGKDLSSRHLRLDDSSRIRSKTFAGLFGGGYSVLQDGASHLDAVAGVRLWNASSSFAFVGGALDSAGTKDSATWVNAVAGLRGQYFLSPNVYLTGWGLVGKGQAKVEWDVMAGVGYAFDQRLSAVAGYRALGVNYNRSGFAYDVVQQGPMMGLVFRF